MSEESKFTIESVAVVCDGEDGLYLEWTLEGGIAALECAGLVLFASNEANDMCDEDGSCELVTADDYDAAQSELAALREELAGANRRLGACINQIEEQQQRLAAAEQRNADMSKLLQRCIPVCRYKGSHTERALINEIETALTKPTESGASE